MWWKYQLVEKSKRLYIYSYSRESEQLDGLIAFDVEKNSVKIMKPAQNDSTSQKAQQKAAEHFGAVISKGFPKEIQVCCG